jgi:SAM-dependent methyltransferase
MQNCLICKSHNTQNYPAKIAEFVRDRIGIKDDRAIGFVRCLNCNFMFFDYRMSDQEMADLYHDYRGEEYQKCRFKYEEFYTEKFNEALGKDEDEIEARKRNLLLAFKKAKIDLVKIKSILDYGGDRGQHLNIEAFEDKEKYLFEVTDLPLEPGVRRVKELKPESFDLVISQHVLEHVPDPQKIMKEMVDSLKSGGYFYFELPFDNPIRNYDFIRKIKFRFFKERFIKGREAKNRHFGMHEHINFFNKKSIETLCKNNGIKPVFFGRVKSEYCDLIFGLAKKIN